MEPIKRIVFPYDFSRQGEQAVPFVRAAASKFAAEVDVVAVVAPAWSTAAAESPHVVGEETIARERATQDRLNRAFEGVLAGIPVRKVTLIGDPALKIVEYAHANAAGLIMMPTHGLGIFRNMLLGSVTSKVLHDARCPVWTATHAEEQRAPAEPRNVLCAVDGDSPGAAYLIRWAAGFCEKTGAALKLVYAVPPVSDWLAIPSERELQEEVRREGEKKLEAVRAEAGVDAPCHVVIGKVTDVVVETARQENADLLIIGRGSAQSTLGRLRTHVYGIVQQSPCPVLSV